MKKESYNTNTVKTLVVIVIFISSISLFFSASTFVKILGLVKNNPNSSFIEELQDLKSRVINIDKKLDSMSALIVAREPEVSPQEQKGLKVGDEAPNFKLREIKEDKIIELKNYKGKKNIVLEAWGFRCPHCIKLIPKMNEFYQYLKNNRKDILLFSVTRAFSSEEEQFIKKVIDENKIAYPVLLTYDEKFGRDYYIRFIPTMFVMNKELKIVAIYQGKDLSDKSLKDLIELIEHDLPKNKKKNEKDNKIKKR